MSRIRKTIAIDGSGLLNNRGISTYISNLVLGISSAHHQYRILLICPAGVSKGRLIETGNNFYIKKFVYINQPIWEYVILPLVAWINGAKMIHYTGNTGGVLLPRILNIKTIVTIHDVSYFKQNILMPDPKNLYQKIGKIYRRYNTPKIAKYSQAVITVSKFAKNDIVSELMISKKKVHITYNSISRSYLSDVDYSVKKNNILIVSGDSPQKNLKYCLQCLNKIKKYIIGWKIQIIGVSSVASDIPVEVIGTVGSELMLDYYNKAKIVLIPSLYESFSLPVIEGMARGAIVVAANRGAIPEITCGNAILYDPKDCNMQIKALKEAVIYSNNILQSNTYDSAVYAKRFNTERQGSLTLKVYEDVFDSQC